MMRLLLVALGLLVGWATHAAPLELEDRQASPDLKVLKGEAGEA